MALTGVPSEPLQHLFELTTGMLQLHALPYDKQRFRPHVTLARFRNPGQNGITLNEQVNVVLDVTRVALYRSTLTSAGSIYEVLKVAKLQRGE